jgi:hypothetical protein
MRTSAECRAKAAEATAHAASIADSTLRAHYDQMADDWARLAVTAFAQETVEAEILGRESDPFRL